jgi:hypothetical protein
MSIGARVLFYCEFKRAFFFCFTEMSEEEKKKVKKGWQPKRADWKVGGAEVFFLWRSMITLLSKAAPGLQLLMLLDCCFMNS